MSIKKVVLASSGAALVAAGTALPLAPANADFDLGERGADVVQISGPKKAKVNKRFEINCDTSASLAGGKVLLYQNGNLLKLKKVRVGTSGVCSFGVISGITGKNELDVAVKKSGQTYQSNSIIVKVKPTKNSTPSATAKNQIKLKAPKTGQLMKKIKLKCQAPVSLAGGRVTLYQNGSILPQKSKFRVASGGTCNFWIKSGIPGVNTFDMSVKKSGKVYQSNAVKVTVS